MVRAYVLIEMTAGHSRELVNVLRGHKAVSDVVRVTGPYDVIAVIEAQDVDQVSDMVTGEIHSQPGVVRTTTSVALS